MSDKKNMQISDDALDSVAGGINDVVNTGNVGGDQTVVDYSQTNIDASTKINTKINGDITGGDKTYGDKVGGDKTDVETNVETNVDVTLKKSLF